MVFTALTGWTVAGLVGLCAALLAVLHILRIRPRRVRVVTTWLWSQAARQTRARTLWHRFRHPWTYVLLLLISALLVTALGRPEFRKVRAAEGATVVILDAGMSMAAPAGHASPWTQAVTTAAAEARRCGAGGPVAVVVADPWPRVLHGFREPGALLERRLRDVKPVDFWPARRPAIQLARSLLGAWRDAAEPQGETQPSSGGPTRPDLQIVIVTDHPQPELWGLSDLVASPFDADGAIDVRFVPVEPAGDNAAIIAAFFEPLRENPFRGRLHVRVGYWGETARAGTLRVHRADPPDAPPLFVETRTFAPNSAVDFAVADLAADGDRLLVDLAIEDAVAGDNRVVAHLPRRTPIRVRVAPDVPSTLVTLLASDPALRLGDQYEPDVDVLTQLVTSPAPAHLLVLGGGPPVSAGAAVQVHAEPGSPRDVRFTVLTCGSGEALPWRSDGSWAAPAGPVPALSSRFDVQMVPLVTEGYALAARGRLDGRPCLLLSPALLGADSAVSRDSALAELILREVRRLAGWPDAGCGVATQRLTLDPLWPERAQVTGTISAIPGTREESAWRGPSPGGGTAEAVVIGGLSGLAPFEVLLFGAFVLLLLEAVLHVRGRIP